MKKIAFLLLIIIIFTSCSKRVNNPEKVQDSIKNGFSVTSNIRYKGMEIKAQLDYLGEERSEIEIISPENIKGMKLISEKGDIKLEFLGLSVNVPKDSELIKNAINTVLDAVNKTANESSEMEIKGNNVEINGKGINGNFTLVMDKKTGALTSLYLPKENINCTFENFTKN